MVERPYSVVSSPHEPELEFFLELVPTGELTPQLYQVPVGGEVQLRRLAKGRFLYDLKSGHPNHFMVATVTGIAPYLSMLRDLVARAAQGEKILHRIVILQGASQSHELGYRDELARYAGMHEWFRLHPHRQPPLAGTGLGRREGPRRRHQPQVSGRLCLHPRRHHGLCLRESQHDRQSQGPAPSSRVSQGIRPGRSLLARGKGVRGGPARYRASARGPRAVL